MHESAEKVLHMLQILILEPNPGVQTVITDFLQEVMRRKEQAYTLLPAQDAAGALLLLREADIAIIDVSQRSSETLIVANEALHRKKIPVIIISAIPKMPLMIRKTKGSDSSQSQGSIWKDSNR